MPSIAVDLTRAYVLSDDTITSRLRVELDRVVAPMPTPAANVRQIIATDERLIALTSSGSGFERLTVPDATWTPITMPPGTMWLAVSDTELLALGSHVWSRPLVGGSFSRYANRPPGPPLLQIDHDESLLYALTSDGRVLLRRKAGGWAEFPALLGVVEIVAGRDGIYARTSDGDVWRTNSFSRGAWSPLGVSDARALAIPSDHSDTLYIGTDAGIRSVDALGWAGERIYPAYCAADYAVDYCTTGEAA